jgi:ATP-dependent Clp protease ATP-binding subunit ClpB
LQLVVLVVLLLHFVPVLYIMFMLWHVNVWRRYIEKDAAFERRLQPVYVAEPSVDATISIIRGLKFKYEAHHGVRIADGAVVAAARLSDRYITSRFLPDKAIDLMDEACAVVRVELGEKTVFLSHLYI